MREFMSTTFEAGEDLDTDGHQYQAIALDDGKVANNGAEALGILLTKPKAGEGGTAAYAGEIKFRAGGAVTKDAPLTVTTSGYFTEADSGDFILGRAASAVSSGGIGRGFFDFAKPAYAFRSEFAW